MVRGDDVERKLRRAMKRIADLDEARESAMRDRDQLLRDAQAQGMTYLVLQHITGLSNATITKALRRQ